MNSIISLNFAKYELIIVNDGSTLPEVEEICLDFAGRYGNVKYFVQENQGSAVARNTGLEHVSGEYVMFVDADDRLAEGLREEFSRIDGDFDILCMGYEKDYPDGRKTLHVTEGYIDFSDRRIDLCRNTLFEHIPTYTSVASAVMKVFRMQFLHENKLRFQPQLRKMQDRMFVIETYYAARKISYRPILCYIVCVNPQSITRKLNFNIIDYDLRVKSAMKKWLDAHPDVGKFAKFFSFYVFHDAMTVSYLHKDCRESIVKTFKGIAESYSRFNVSESLKQITFRELIRFRSSKQRLKLFSAKVFGKYGYSLLMTAVALARRYIL